MKMFLIGYFSLSAVLNLFSIAIQAKQGGVNKIEVSLVSVILNTGLMVACGLWL